MTTEHELLAAVKIDILSMEISDFQELAEQDFDTKEGKIYFLEFCHRVVEGGIIQFIVQPDLLMLVVEKVGDELQTHGQFIGEAVQFAQQSPFTYT